MANIHLEAPARFKLSCPEDWTKWKRRFNQYLIASGLAEERVCQISTLLYCMGEEADMILTSTNISCDDRKKYDQVVAKLDAFFKERNNVIYE